MTFVCSYTAPSVSAILFSFVHQSSACEGNFHLIAERNQGIFSDVREKDISRSKGKFSFGPFRGTVNMLARFELAGFKLFSNHPSFLFRVDSIAILGLYIWILAFLYILFRPIAIFPYCVVFFGARTRQVCRQLFPSLSRSYSLIVQSLNSLFHAPFIGVEPWRAKRESRITCMRMLRMNQS